MSGADAVLAHGMLNAMAAISASASTLRRVPPHRYEEFCAILERQVQLVEAFVYGMTESARRALEEPLGHVASMATRLVGLARHEPGVPIDGLLSALIGSCEEAAAALRDFVHGFSPEVVAALERLGEHRRAMPDAGGSAAP